MYLEHNASIGDPAYIKLLVVIMVQHLIKEVELEIGGQMIDKHYGHWHGLLSVD